MRRPIKLFLHKHDATQAGSHQNDDLAFAQARRRRFQPRRQVPVKTTTLQFILHKREQSRHASAVPLIPQAAVAPCFASRLLPARSAHVHLGNEAHEFSLGDVAPTLCHLSFAAQDMAPRRNAPLSVGSSSCL